MFTPKLRDVEAVIIGGVSYPVTGRSFQVTTIAIDPENPDFPVIPGFVFVTAFMGQDELRRMSGPLSSIDGFVERRQED